MYKDVCGQGCMWTGMRNILFSKKQKYLHKLVLLSHFLHGMIAVKRNIKVVWSENVLLGVQVVKEVKGSRMYGY